MLTHFWFQDPRSQMRDGLMTVDLPTSPEKGEVVQFQLDDVLHWKDGKHDVIKVHTKVKRRTWVVKQQPMSHDVEVEVNVYCVPPGEMED